MHPLAETRRSKLACKGTAIVVSLASLEEKAAAVTATHFHIHPTKSKHDHIQVKIELLAYRAESQEYLQDFPYETRNLHPVAPSPAPSPSDLVEIYANAPAHAQGTQRPADAAGILQPIAPADTLANDGAGSKFNLDAHRQVRSKDTFQTLLVLLSRQRALMYLTAR